MTQRELTNEYARSRQPKRAHDMVHEFFRPSRYFSRAHLVRNFDVKDCNLFGMKGANCFAKMSSLRRCAFPGMAKMVITARGKIFGAHSLFVVSERRVNIVRAFCGLGKRERGTSLRRTI